MPSVRAKFRCSGIHHGEVLTTVEMFPVYGNGDPAHENTKFWKASPQGKLELGCVHREAADQFVLGKEYYLDFTPAE